MVIMVAIDKSGVVPTIRGGLRGPSSMISGIETTKIVKTIREPIEIQYLSGGLSTVIIMSTIIVKIKNMAILKGDILEKKSLKGFEVLTSLIGRA